MTTYRVQFFKKIESQSEKDGTRSVIFTQNLISLHKNIGKVKNPQLSSSLNVPIGDEVYLVWGEYSTMKGLDVEINTGVELLGIFLNLDVAQSFAQTIGKINDKMEESEFYWKPVKIQALDGQEITINNPAWNNDYTRLESVKFDKIVVKP